MSSISFETLHQLGKKMVHASKPDEFDNLSNVISSSKLCT
jgi:hypothetical protein